jgi:hypothetical protein
MKRNQPPSRTGTKDVGLDGVPHAQAGQLAGGAALTHTVSSSPALSAA